MYIPFDQMPLYSRIWMYQADRKFSSEEKKLIVQQLTNFCQQWNTHGTSMPTSFDIRYDQIILLAVDESQLSASGCSIDSSVRTIKEIEERLNINLLDHGKISFMNSNDELEVTSAFSVKAKIQEGAIVAETPVLNPMVNKIEDLSSHWKIQARESWLKKYFSN
jgi:hypothetical protein